MSDTYDLATAGDYDVLRRLSKGKRCVFEFGTFLGGSALAMLPQIIEANGHLYCVDHFRGNPNDPLTALPPWQMLGTLMRRIEPYLDHVTVIVGRTSEVFDLPNAIADLVFIDAAHGYHAVRGDIARALHLLKPGGTIAGHDYIKHFEDCDPELMRRYADTEDGGFEGVGYGVIKAVHEAFGRPEHEGAVWWAKV